MLKGRTRLLITNQLQYLPQCDHICFMLKVCCGCTVCMCGKLGLPSLAMPQQGTVQEPLCDERSSAALSQGRVAEQGSYQEVQRHPAVAELLAEFNSSGGSGPAGRPESTSSGADADDDASDTPEVLSPAFLSRLLALNLASGVGQL